MDNFILLLETLIIWFMDSAKWCLIAAVVLTIIALILIGTKTILVSIYGERKLTRMIKSFLA